MLGGLDGGWEGKGREGSGGIFRHLLGNLDNETEGKTIQKFILLFKCLKCYTNKNVLRMFDRPKPSPRSNSTILIKFHEQTAQLQNAYVCNCAYFVEDFRSPQLWSVSVGYASLGHKGTAQRSIGPVALSSFTIQIQVELSVQLLQYHGLTASLLLVQWCLL